MSITTQQEFDSACEAICAGTATARQRRDMWNTVDRAMAMATPKTLKIIHSHIVTKKSGIFKVGKREQNESKAQDVLLHIMSQQDYISIDIFAIDDAIANHVDNYVDEYIMPALNFYFHLAH